MILGLFFASYALGAVQAQEVIEQMTIQVGTDLTEYQNYGNMKSVGVWGYGTDAPHLLGALLLPLPHVEVRVVGGTRYKWEGDPDYCSIQFAVTGEAPEQIEYLKSITKLKYGGYEFSISEGDGDKAVMPINGMTALVVQQRSCAFADAFEAAYPQGSTVEISIVRQTADLLPPAILDVGFSLQSGFPGSVPVSGGPIYYSGALSNSSDVGKSIHYWITTRLPDGSGYPLSTPRSATVAAGSQLSELESFGVPAWFPAGSYTARLVAADSVTGELVSQEIAFSKADN